MNERIFELADLALEETHRVMGSTCLQEAFDDFYTEKFAELIVRECALVVYKKTGPKSALNVLEHFGVEE